MSEASKKAEKPQDATEIKDLTNDITGDLAEQVKGGVTVRKSDLDDAFMRRLR